MTQKQTTEDLILGLAAKPLPPRLSPLALIVAMGVLAALCVAQFLLTHGVRADLAAALSKLVTFSKSGLPLLTAVLALWLAIRSARPGVGLRLWLLALPAVAGLLLVAFRFATMGDAPVMPELIGKSAFNCVTYVTSLALLPMAAGVFMLRRGAPTRPALSGALLGLAAGAGVTMGYALHCTEDSPLFFVLWYGLAIVLSGAIGAAAGWRFLRW